jgi:MFS family permease
MNAFALFRETPGYAHLLLLRAIGSIILWTDFTLIFSNITYYWRADSTTIGVASALYGLPGLLLGPYFGKLADNHHPVSVLTASYAFRAATSLLLMLSPNINVFILLVFLKGISNLGSAPAEQVLTRQLLGPAQLIENARWVTLIDQSLKVTAPLIAAAMTLLHRPEYGFVLPSLLALVALLVLYRLNRTCVTRTNLENQRKHPQFRALIELLSLNATFRFSLIASLIQTAVLGLYDPLLALFLKEQAFSPATFGTIVSCTAAGGIGAALLFKRIFVSINPTQVVAIGLMGFGLTVAVPGGLASLRCLTSEYVLFTFWLANGCFYGITAMSFGVIMQATSPSHSLGTISATARSAQLAALVSGPLVGSILASVSSIPAVFMMSGATAILAGATLYAHQLLSQPELPHPVDSSQTD